MSSNLMSSFYWTDRQIQYFAGSILGAFMLLGLYYSNAWSAKVSTSTSCRILAR